jgi:hypothetical protein
LDAPVIVAAPTASALNWPLPVTLAIAELALLQLTVGFGITYPEASLTIADICKAPPTGTTMSAGPTPTLAPTGTKSSTVTVAAPTLPSEVAVMVAVPPAIPIANPDCVTDAIAGSLLDQATALLVRKPPFASLGVAVNWIWTPTEAETLVGETRTDATGIGVGAVESEPPPPQEI